MSRYAIILGIGSDIGREIGARLERDGWAVSGIRHDDVLLPDSWNLIVCCYGTLEPIGGFWEQQDIGKWERAWRTNLFLPLRQIKVLYPHRRPGASVCFFSGAGTNGPAPTYSAYAASKIALVKMVELMDDESPDCKFFILGPGVVNTKIHQQTLEAGPDRAANYDRVTQLVATGDPGTNHDGIYACLMACVAAPKAAVGGRNVYVPKDDWSRLGELEGSTCIFKLRRDRDDYLRESHRG